MEKGLVQIYTGNGKGKTTAAIGQGIRALGRGLSVVMIRFLKGNESGESIFIKKNVPDFIIYSFNSLNKPVWEMNENERDALKQETLAGLNRAKKIMSNMECSMLILDEVTGAVNRGFIQVNDIIDLINTKPDSIELILTGRDADIKIIEKADLVTEMKKIRHPFDSGIPARVGIER